MTVRFAVVIPAYNAAGALSEVLIGLETHRVPVAVVDDGSTDTTASVAEPFEIALLRHTRNRGKGAALKTGMEWAAANSFTHVLTLDADGQHPMASIPDFIREAERYPDCLLIGNRFGRSAREMPGVRRLSNTLSSRLISFFARTRIPDAQCGMRVYPVDLFLSLAPQSDGYALESEILVAAGRNGLTIRNLKIPCLYPTGTQTSHYRALSDSWRIARAVARTVLRSRWNKQ